MKQTTWVLLISLLFIQTCADDIKGDKGDPGQDAVLDPYIRLHRPAFHSFSNTVLGVDGSTNSPIILKLGSSVITSTTSIFLDIAKNGAGGLRDGLDAAASTIYYLYGVLAGTSAALVADTNPPSSGPDGFTDWTYIGAFATNGSSQLLEFSSSGGFFQANSLLGGSSPVTSTTFTAFAVSPCPVTIKKHYGLVSVLSGTTVGRVGQVSGTNTSGSGSLEAVNQNVTSDPNEIFGFVPALSGSTVYLRVNNADATVRYFPSGWVDDPMEWQ